MPHQEAYTSGRVVACASVSLVISTGTQNWSSKAPMGHCWHEHGLMSRAFTTDRAECMQHLEEADKVLLVFRSQLCHHANIQ